MVDRERTLIKNLPQYLGKDAQVCGWIETLRDQKRMQFMIVRDHTGLAQGIVDKREDPNLAEQISTLTPESVISLTGLVVNNPRVRLGGLEIQAKAISIHNLAAPLPIDISGRTESGSEQRSDWRFLDLRRPENHLIFAVQTTAEAAMRTYWIKNGFIEIHSPKLMGTPSESGAELFGLDYFGKKAYLAQSPQHYKQMAMSAGFDRVFEIGPVFRANPSFTSRHDTEFTSVDMEMSWINSHEDVMAFEEQWLQHTFKTVTEKHGDEIKQRFGSEIVVPHLPFPRLSMTEAVEILRNQGHIAPPETKGDLDPQGERMLGDYVRKIFDHEFLFVTDYPSSVRPFYHMRHDNQPELTKSYDLLWKGLEITTGAQREHRPNILEAQALEKDLTLEGNKYYLDFFRYGCPPHGGFGFGLTRMLMLMMNRKNVREVTYLYRGPNRLTP